MVKRFQEEAIMNTGSGIAGFDTPPVRKKKKEQYGMSRFAGRAVWVVPEGMYYDAYLGKKKFERFDNYLDGYEHLDEIREYAHAYSSEPIIIQNEKTGAMIYLKYGKK